MNAELTDERSEGLTGEPASVGRARRLVVEALEHWGFEHLVDDASLLVSELVTNAVLHAGTDVELRILRCAGGVRIEVADGSPVLPAGRHFDDSAVTGRGLHILGATASAWGATGTASGKVVWFDLGGANLPVPSSVDAPPARETIPVQWKGIPTRLAKATVQHGDAMLRELALSSFDEGADGLSIMPMVTPSLDLAELLAKVDAAIEAGEPTTDVTIRMAPEAADAALHRLALVDEADRMAEDGALLVPAALPEIVACRQWLLSQIVTQAAGAAALPWTMPATPTPSRDWEPLTDDEANILGEDRPHSVVVDQENRMVFVGDAVARLLGADDDELVGRRLTDIVPPDLREAHLVGFTRYQITGRASLFGMPLRLRARHLSGDDIPITITLDALPRHRGRYRHRAHLVSQSGD